ncbi:MAG: HPF/RaiA family ribosome-associated protein [Bacteroidetes bacterium]|nr:HPF/RaiA family ribosome-associated protein [Bacteroidota bacterium]
MQIQINTDNTIQGHAAFTTEISSKVESAFSRFSEEITRVELHLSDENGEKSGRDDKKCVLEVRLKGKQPIAVTEQNVTLDKSISGAIEKMTRLIESTQDKKTSQERHRSDPLKHYTTTPND